MITAARSRSEGLRAVLRFASAQRGRAAIGRRVGRTMLGIVRPTDRHGLRGGPRRDQSRLDPPNATLPRSPQPEIARPETVRKKTLLWRRDEGSREHFPVPADVFDARRDWQTVRPEHDTTLPDVAGFDNTALAVRHLHRIARLQSSHRLFFKPSLDRANCSGGARGPSSSKWRSSTGSETARSVGSS